jgi:hypothetical protein
VKYGQEGQQRVFENAAKKLKFSITLPFKVDDLVNAIWKRLKDAVERTTCMNHTAFNAIINNTQNDHKFTHSNTHAKKSMLNHCNISICDLQTEELVIQAVSLI